MGRYEDHSFNVTFVLKGDKYANLNPTQKDVKDLVEKWGIKVSLPNSYGDPIIMEYNDGKVVPKPVAPIIPQKPVVPVAPPKPAVAPLSPKPATPPIKKP